MLTDHPFLPDRFGLSAMDLRKALSLALGRGGDFAELFFEYRTTNTIHMEEGIIKETGEQITQGVGVRVLSDLRLESQELTIPLGRKNRSGRIIYFSEVLS